jgi:hypothetical protein
MAPDGVARSDRYRWAPSGAGPARRRRPGEGVNPGEHSAGQRRRPDGPVTSRRAVEIGVELLDKHHGPQHVHLVEDLHGDVRGRSVLPKLCAGQSPCQLSGDGDGVDEKRIHRLDVVLAGGLPQPSQQLVQVLAEGAQVPPHGLLLAGAMRRLVEAVVGVDQDLQARKRGRLGTACPLGAGRRPCAHHQFHGLGFLHPPFLGEWEYNNNYNNHTNIRAGTSGSGSSRTDPASGRRQAQSLAAPAP